MKHGEPIVRFFRSSPDEVRRTADEYDRRIAAGETNFEIRMPEGRLKMVVKRGSWKLKQDGPAWEWVR